MEARLEEIRKKYQDAKREESAIDFLSLKREIELFIETLSSSSNKNDDLLAKVEDMLIDLIKIIEEGHCQPFRPKKV